MNPARGNKEILLDTAIVLAMKPRIEHHGQNSAEDIRIIPPMLPHSQIAHYIDNHFI